MIGHDERGAVRALRLMREEVAPLGSGGKLDFKAKIERSHVMPRFQQLKASKAQHGFNSCSNSITSPLQAGVVGNNRAVVRRRLRQPTQVSS